MTAESDGKGRRGGQPDLLASLPAEHPPSSRPEPDIDPAAIEELLAGVRDLREQLAGVNEAVSAERPVALTPEALQAWGDDLVARVVEAARTAERIDGGLDSTADRVATEVGEAVTRIETGLMKTRDHVDRVSRLAHGALQDIETRVSGRFSKWTIIAGVIVFALGMLLESRALIIYRWLW